MKRRCSSNSHRCRAAIIAGGAVFGVTRQHQHRARARRGVSNNRRKNRKMAAGHQSAAIISGSGNQRAPLWALSLARQLGMARSINKKNRTLAAHRARSGISICRCFRACGAYACFISFSGDMATVIAVFISVWRSCCVCWATQ